MTENLDTGVTRVITVRTSSFTKAAFKWNERLVFSAEKVKLQYFFLVNIQFLYLWFLVGNDTINNYGGFFTCNVNNLENITKNCKKVKWTFHCVF